MMLVSVMAWMQARGVESSHPQQAFCLSKAYANVQWVAA